MNITSDTPQPSVIERIARIRQRMRVEQVTGIAAAQKEIFLPLCLESETSDENWSDDWDDWPDR